jgi:adenylyl-sulfate kinase
MDDFSQSANAAVPWLRERGLAVWFTGLSGAGKTTLCGAVAERLRRRGAAVVMLDGDELRHGVNADLGYSREDREENIRRIGAMAEDLVAQRTIVLVAAISPYRAMRDAIRRESSAFVEVHVHAPLSTCMERDTKGLYRRALAGEIDRFTGISDPYETPLAPEVRCDTAEESVHASADKVMVVLARMLEYEEQIVSDKSILL